MKLYGTTVSSQLAHVVFLHVLTYYNRTKMTIVTTTIANHHLGERRF